MSELTFEVEVQSAEVDVDLVEPTVAAVLVAGPSGAQGPPGPAAPSYIHTQSTAAATWIVSHTLGRAPYAVLIVVGGELVNTDVEFPDSSTVVVTFASPQAGSLRLT